MSTFDHACSTLAHIIRDYRQGELPQPDATHVATWAAQFPEPVRWPIVAELGHVLERSYCSKDRAIAFLDRLVTSAPIAFWQATEVMQLQTDGNSQRELVAMLEANLVTRHGLSLAGCGHGGGGAICIWMTVFSLAAGSSRT